VEDSIGGGSFLEFQKGFGKPGLSPTVAAFRLPKGAWGCPEEPWAHWRSLELTGGALGLLEVPKVDLRGARLNQILWSISSQSLPS
jgi:hypothetical protein